MPELAKAYVQIIPSAEGIKGNLTKIMDGEADSAGKSAGGKFGSAFGSVAKAGLAAVGAGLAAASAAVVKVAKDAVEGYADYEQLTGGIVTMFEDLAWDVEENANRAFQTAGLSANEYMETVMGFSASLNQSLIANEGNIARAADLSDQIITDMADNANKMGTSMESIQNAYSGFAKQNYTMLDNLKLGYGGTKEEMERLLADAAELTGREYDVSNFADIAEAIHAIQTEIGITGTTALEGSATISGSLAAMGAAWKNLVVGMASEDADLSGLIGNVVDTAETAFGNILPVAEQALTGIASFVEQIAPVIAEKLPGLVEAVLPSILSAATTLVTALVEALPTLMQVLIDQGPVIVNTLLEKILEMLPEIVTLGLTLLTSLAQGIADNLDELIPTVVDVVLQIVDTLTDPQTLGNLIDAAIAIIVALAEGLINSLPKLAEKAPEIIQNLVDALVQNLPKLLTASVQIMVKLAKGLIDNLPEIFKAAGKIVAEIIAGIGNAISGLFTAGKDALLKVKEGFDSFDPKQWGKDLIDNFVGGITQKWEDLKSSVRGVAQTVKDLLGFSEPKEGPLSNFHTFAPDMMMLFAKGIRDNEYLVEDQLKKSLDFSEALENTWEPDRLSSAVRGAGAYRFGGAPGTASGEAGRIDAAALAQAVASALEGCGVYMDGHAVGRLVTRVQANTARAYG